jgi:hypothetical protein
MQPKLILCPAVCNAQHFVGHGAEIWIFTGQWSLPYKSGRMDHSRWIAGLGLQKARSREDKDTDPEQKFMSVSVFKRIRLYPALETTLPPMSIRTEPQRIFLSMKSPSRINGGGNCVIRLARSAGSTGTSSGKYMFQIKYTHPSIYERNSVNKNCL